MRVCVNYRTKSKVPFWRGERERASASTTLRGINTRDMKNSEVFVLMMICNKPEADCTIFITLCKLRCLETGGGGSIARRISHSAAGKYMQHKQHNMTNLGEWVSGDGTGTEMRRRKRHHLSSWSARNPLNRRFLPQVCERACPTWPHHFPSWA